MDDIDRAKLRQQEEIDHALAARRAAAQGRTECEECSSEITPLRQGLGARLCIECQRRVEQRAAQWKVRS